jgi:hypothetical protein
VAFNVSFFDGAPFQNTKTDAAYVLAVRRHW